MESLAKMMSSKDFNMLKEVIGVLDQQHLSKQDSTDPLKEVEKELMENGSAINATMKKIFSLLKSDDKKNIVGKVELHCTELKKLQSKSDELINRFTVTANKVAGQLEAQEEKKKGKKKACGLCGKTKKVTKTRCCDRWICDDEDQYVLFSYAKNSCYRNHHRYTLCCSHFNENHSGKWQDCIKCKEDCEPEMYVWYATNEYNYEKLDIPKIKIKCENCTFESYEVEDFAGSSSKGNEPTKWYCKKEKCMINSPMAMHG